MLQIERGGYRNHKETHFSLMENDINHMCKVDVQPWTLGKVTNGHPKKKKKPYAISQKTTNSLFLFHKVQLTHFPLSPHFQLSTKSLFRENHTLSSFFPLSSLFCSPVEPTNSPPLSSCPSWAFIANWWRGVGTKVIGEELAEEQVGMLLADKSMVCCGCLLLLMEEACSGASWSMGEQCCALCGLRRTASLSSIQTLSQLEKDVCMHGNGGVL